MALINIPGSTDVVIWSSIPLGAEFDKAFSELSSDALHVLAAIVPDKEHTLNAQALKEKYPNALLIGPSGITDKPDLKLDYTFEDSQANQVVNGAAITPRLSQFDFVFLNGHANREVVMVDSHTKTLFEADLLFNVPHDGVNADQYPDENQNKGLWGYFTATLNSESKVGRFIHQKLLPNNDDNIKGLRALLSLDFGTVVMSHGSVIESDGKASFKQMFPYA